jgi:hypothetical protein
VGELQQDFCACGNGDRAKALNKSTGVENNPVGRLIGLEIQKLI